MPALWQSSQRPMYIRTVWVDGFRHAILTHDDPHFLKLAKRRPHSSASCAKSSLSRNVRLSRDFGDRYGKLNLVIRNDKPNEPQVEKLHLTDVENCEEEFIIKASPQPLCEINNFRLTLDTGTMRAVKSNRTARTEVKENTELSERVLQWLDLAGKVNLLTQDAERMTQPRRSWPEIQSRNLTKSKTATDLRTKDTKQIDVKTSAGIDRQEYYMPSANTIENYARQSRNVKSTPRNDTKKENKKVKDLKASVMETRQKVANERSAVEKQYADLVSKKLIPDVGKTKKQVHIFMPESLNKKFNSNPSSVVGSVSQMSQKS